MTNTAGAGSRRQRRLQSIAQAEAGLVKDYRVRAPHLLLTGQRHLLWSLITDARFRPIWIHGREHFKNGLKREKSLHAHRHPACAAAYRAVCAQAGREFISWTEYHELMSPENSDAQLEALLQKLKAYPLAK